MKLLRLIKYFVLLVISLALVILAFANRDSVTLQLMPEEMAAWTGLTIAPLEVPLFVVIFAGVMVGLLIGFIWEWLREYRLRAEGSRHARERTKLEREVATLKGRSGKSDDDVLALLEDGGRTG